LSGPKRKSVETSRNDTHNEVTDLSRVGGIAFLPSKGFQSFHQIEDPARPRYRAFRSCCEDFPAFSLEALARIVGEYMVNLKLWMNPCRAETTANLPHFMIRAQMQRAYLAILKSVVYTQEGRCLPEHESTTQGKKWCSVPNHRKETASEV
jgi:hypothetical protein